MASIQDDRTCNPIKTIVVISIISMLALGMLFLPTFVYAQADAYSKGYKDATCDAVSCNGHGYDPRCPGDHSSEYCNNYRDGYATGWASANANNDGQEQNNSQPPQQPQDQGQGQSPSQSQSQSQGGITNNNNPTIIINPK